MNFNKIEPYVDSTKALQTVVETCFKKNIKTLFVTSNLIESTYLHKSKIGCSVKIGTVIGDDTNETGILKLQHSPAQIFDADYFEIVSKATNVNIIVYDISQITDFLKTRLSSDIRIYMRAPNMSVLNIDQIIDLFGETTKPDCICLNQNNVECAKTIIERTAFSIKLNASSSDSIDDTFNYYGISASTLAQLTKN